MTTTTDRKDPELHEDRGDGQNKKYLVLSDEERAKGFVRPVRTTYVHKRCGHRTSMGRSIAETYARDPTFYGATFCVNCGTHYALVGANGERMFTWEDGSGVGE